MSGQERVYRLDVRTRQHVIVDVTAEFDSVLYLRKGSCEDEDAEIQCNDDAGPKHSRIDTVLEPGTYFVFVDGYGEDAGNFHLDVKTADVPSVAEICQQAPPLPSSAQVAGTLKDALDNVNATCGRDAKGADAPYRFDLPVRARVRFVERSADFHPVVHVRRVCEDPTSEVACSESGFTDDEAAYVGMLDPGTYAVFADGSDESTTGSFTLSAESVPMSGGRADHAPGDGCGEAIDLVGKAGKVDGDTFATHDHARFSCGGTGAADIFYRVEVTERSRLVARIVGDQSSHVLGLMRSCGEGAVELACGSILDRALDAGTYFLVADGAQPESLGRFEMTYRLKNIARLEAACARASVLRFGHTESGNTSGAGDNFSLSCAPRGRGGAGASSPDRVYRFSVPGTMPVDLALDAQSFRGSFAVRRSCMDDNSEVHCAASPDGPGQVSTSMNLDRGTYYLVVDGYGPGAEGAFTLRLDAGKHESGHTFRHPARRPGQPAQPPQVP